jgi:spore germination protein YaaH
MDAKTLTHRLDVKDNHINNGEAMKNIHIGGRKERLGRKVVLALLFIFMIQPLWAQVATDEKPQKPEVDSTVVQLELNNKVEDEKRGLIAEFLQFFKFRQNIDRREKERIQKFLEELIQNDSLKVETETLERVLNEINRKVSQDRISIDTLQSKANQSKEDIEKNTDSIIASKNKLESLKSRLTAIIKESNSRLSAEEKEINEEIRLKLKLLKGVEESCDSKNLIIEEEPLNKEGQTGTLTFKRCLNPEVQVIGWHSVADAEAYKTYTYNYLSAINLYGYKVMSNGDNSKKVDLLEFQKSGGVIDYARANNTDIHLTVYSPTRKEAHRLIENPVSQDRLVDNLKRLVFDYSMKGINISFENIPEDHEAVFVSFIKRLYFEMRKIDTDIQLNITLPAIWNQTTLQQANNYDFEALAPYVNYFYVTTDAMTNRYNDIAQAASPLMSKGLERPYSIASTVDFYTNGRIAAEKLIVTLSYEGIEWDVKDFTAVRDRDSRGVFVAYKNIPRLYKDNSSYVNEVIEGYDEDQATTYVNISQINRSSDEASFKQVWFEDMRSLYEKYNWIKKNELGGVAVKRLGANDPSRSGLWDAMGAALVKVDTIDKVEHIHPKKKELNKFKVFISDWKWSDDASLEYYFNVQNDSIRLCTDGQIAKREADKNDVLPELTDYWLVYQKFIPFKERDSIKTFGGYMKKPHLLRDFTECRCLMGRWQWYSNKFLWIAGICTLLILILKVVVYRYDRFLIGKKKRPILRLVQGVLFLIGLPALLAGIWIAPWNPFVGTNSDGSSRIDVVILGSVVIGLILGWIIRKWMISGRWRQSLLN